MAYIQEVLVLLLFDEIGHQRGKAICMVLQVCVDSDYLDGDRLSA